jgi:hypothetical protein
MPYSGEEGLLSWASLAYYIHPWTTAFKATTTLKLEEALGSRPFPIHIDPCTRVLLHVTKPPCNFKGKFLFFANFNFLVN